MEEIEIIEELNKAFKKQTAFQSDAVVQHGSELAPRIVSIMNRYYCQHCHGTSRYVAVHKEVIRDLDDLKEKFEGYIKIVEKHNKNRKRGFLGFGKEKEWKIEDRFFGAGFRKIFIYKDYFDLIDKYSFILPPFCRAYVTCPYCKEDFAFKYKEK